jgi:hypothetical protein
MQVTSPADVEALTTCCCAPPYSHDDTFFE